LHPARQRRYFAVQFSTTLTRKRFVPDQMNPYQSLPPESFWRSGVAEEDPRTIKNLYRKKFSIAKSDKIATAGSCFAQHVAAHLRERGCTILDVERPPTGLSGDEAKAFGYLIYSARYGNIYTTRQLLQLLRDAYGETVRGEDVWEAKGRFYDALRPGVEPGGLSSAGEVMAQRLNHLAQVRSLFGRTGVFIFTLGLTETWAHRASGTVYPTCPGVVAGEFDPETYIFCNFGFPEILRDLQEVRSLLKERNPKMRFIFTVSPVPLVATASGEHVLVATTYSKSTLRAVCGAMTQSFDDVDYFPSYELVISPFTRGSFFESNLRSVTLDGVESVMRVFLSAHGFDQLPCDHPPPATEKASSIESESTKAEELICEEELLEAFRP
jgi:GSCFA family